MSNAVDDVEGVGKDDVVKVKKIKKSSGSSTVDDFNFSTYVYRVLKQVHPDTGISGSALATMVNLIKVNISKIIFVMNQISIRTGAKTLTSRDVITSIKICIPGELAKHGVSEAIKAVQLYKADINSEKKVSNTRNKPKQRSSRAGLSFNVTRVENLMMLQASARRKSGDSAVALSAVLEYLAAEVLELAGNCARDNKKVRITPRHIKLAISNDEELNRLYKDTIISGGVVSKIHTRLLPEVSNEGVKIRKSKTSVKPKIKKSLKKKNNKK
jgi:histone H2A